MPTEMVSRPLNMNTAGEAILKKAPRISNKDGYICFLGIFVSSELSKKHCVACEGGAIPMSTEESLKYVEKVPGWNLVVDRIEKEFRFRNYLDGLEFAYALGKIAEEEDHHPDILVRWRRVEVTLMTHAIKGLSENDFIMAAKADELYKRFIF